MAINYTEEKQRLESYVPMDGDYWSPMPGQYKVTALGELEEAEPFPDDAEKKARVNLSIEIEDIGPEPKKLKWGMAVGKTPTSIYGQLINLATSKQGMLKGLKFTVVVVGEGRDKRFTVVI